MCLAPREPTASRTARSPVAAVGAAFFANGFGSANPGLSSVVVLSRKTKPPANAAVVVRREGSIQSLLGTFDIANDDHSNLLSAPELSTAAMGAGFSRAPGS